MDNARRCLLIVFIMKFICSQVEYFKCDVKLSEVTEEVDELKQLESIVHNIKLLRVK